MRPNSRVHIVGDCNGAVLVIVLAFMVLLTCLIVAFFSRALSERLISNSSANQTAVNIFAQGALDMIVGDLKQEIADGSTPSLITTGAFATIVYTAKAPATAVPATSGFTRVIASGTETDGLNNLVKRSASGEAFYFGANYTATGPSRAANVSTTTASRNGRFISPARWNKPLLLPKAAPASNTDFTPVAAFTEPDWILVARDGSNPTAWNSNMIISANSAISVVDRYAYAIYDVGGLLDANAAGYPTGMTSSQLAYKNTLGFADLTQLRDSSGNQLLTQSQIDSIVCWRNYATIQPPNSFPHYNITGTAVAARYYNAALSNTKGFLTIANSSLYSGQSDRMFASRQELISLLTKGVANSSSVQNALQYLTVFSRDLNQPSLRPNPGRPKVVSGDGGNDAYGNDDSINPSFLAIRVTSPFMRNDGTQAVVGEPLVKKRFALNRLAWLTFAGPSAGRTNMNDPDIQTLMQNGILWSNLQQGDQGHIYKYFGLYWDSTKNRWVYNHSSGAAPSAVPVASGPIMTLSQVAALTGINAREPDFIELLKAAVNVGSISKGATAHMAIPTCNMSAVTGSLSWEDYQFQRDISTDYTIIQMAANIIDQFDSDGYPARISFDAGTGTGLQDFAGVENLPYFYRARPGVIVVQQPSPGTTGTADPPRNSGTNALVKPGIAITFLQPEIWNPHDAGSSMGNPRPGTAQLRLVADSYIPGGIPVTIGEKSVTGTSPGTPFTGVQYSDSAVRSPAFYNDYLPDLVTLSASNTALTFSDNGGVFFREPTLLIQPDVPGGCGLTIDGTNNLLVQKFSADPLLAPFLITGTTAAKYRYVQSAVGSGNSNYIGIYLGVAPLRWVAQSGSVKYVLSARQADFATLTSSDSPVTYRMQYQDAGGSWQTYDQKVTDILGGGNVVEWQSLKITSYGMIGQQALVSCIDPRTDRFGTGGGFNNVSTFPGSSNLLDSANNVLPTNRSDQTLGSGIGLWSLPPTNAGDFPYQPPARGLPSVAGWYPSSQPWNSVSSKGTNFFYTGLFTQNSASLSQYYTDPDGVVRRAMGAYISANLTSAPFYGSPLATSLNYAVSPAANYTGVTATTQSRPIILNRPFKSVADLGYVFSGTPWKNLDMFTPESGYAALLDIFCINDTDNLDGLVAGKVNLNTRQAPVLKVILAGAYKDELNVSGSSIITGGSNSSIASQIANALVARTTSVSIGKGPLTNISELVGKWTAANYVNGDSTKGIDGSASYDGFSNDLSSIFSADPASNNIERFREASLRALANTGTTRVWNLMIDLVAQTGRYPIGASGLSDFLVEGEQRYWVHIAIDRFTGQVIDKQIEVVKE